MVGGGLLHLWNEVGVQIMVLVSFALQVFLLAYGGIRRRNSSVVLRIALWLAYLSADSTATYTLGHLSMASRSREHQLVAFWAPFLLLHLGGPDNITAYALEDNRLWLRHLQTLTVQTVGAAYVVYKYIAIDEKGTLLLLATTSMFVAGLVKYGERIWALKRGNIKSIANNFDWSDDGVKCYESWRLCPSDEEKILLGAHSHFGICKDAFTDATSSVNSESNRGDKRSAKSESKNGDESSAKSEPKRGEESSANSVSETGDERLANSESTSRGDECPKQAYLNLYKLVEMELSLMYDILYTKAAVIHTWYGLCIHFISLLGAATAFLLFQLSIGSSEDGYSKVDVVITNVLLVGALVLEAMSLCRALLSTWTCSFLNRSEWQWLLSVITSLRQRFQPASRRVWPGSIGQYNLLEMCTSNRKGIVHWLAKKAGLEDWWNKLQFSGTFSGSQCCSVEDLKLLVLGAMATIDTGMNSRGSAALQRNNCEEQYKWSFDMDLDKSILVWHIVTDLVIRLPRDGEQLDKRLVEATKVLSNYMMFLLVFEPDMLPGRIRRNVYLNACKELENCRRACLKKWSLWAEVESRPQVDMLADWLLADSYNTLSKPDSDRPSEIIQINRHDSEGGEEEAEHAKDVYNAIWIYERLRSRPHDKVTWMEIIFQMWVEMMVYIAEHCSRDSHARQLSHGGEFITIVWLMLHHLKYYPVLEDAKPK